MLRLGSHPEAVPSFAATVARPRGGSPAPPRPARPRGVTGRRAWRGSPRRGGQRSSRRCADGRRSRRCHPAEQLAKARLATGKYATDLHRAKADGYQIITRMIPDMATTSSTPPSADSTSASPRSWSISGAGTPGSSARSSGCSPSGPRPPPLPGATYGSFDAACHYKDGTFVVASSQAQCPRRSPRTNARFNFWHPPLVTLHVWLWYHNPDGLYSGTNPLLRPFHRG